MKSKFLLSAVLISQILIPVSAENVPNIFVPNTSANAADVNQNFLFLSDRVVASELPAGMLNNVANLTDEQKQAINDARAELVVKGAKVIDVECGDDTYALRKAYLANSQYLNLVFNISGACSRDLGLGTGTKTNTITINGMNSAAALISATDNPDWLLFAQTGAQGLFLNDLAIESSNPDTWAGVYISQNARAYLRNVTISGFRQGVVAFGGGYVRLDNVTVEDVAVGIVANGGSIVDLRGVNTINSDRLKHGVNVSGSTIVQSDSLDISGSIDPNEGFAPAINLRHGSTWYSQWDGSITTIGEVLLSENSLMSIPNLTMSGGNLSLENAKIWGTRGSAAHYDITGKINLGGSSTMTLNQLTINGGSIVPNEDECLLCVSDNSFVQTGWESGSELTSIINGPVRFDMGSVGQIGRTAINGQLDISNNSTVNLDNESVVTLSDTQPRTNVSNNSVLQINNTSAINNGEIVINGASTLSAGGSDLSDSLVSLRLASTAVINGGSLGVIRVHDNSTATLGNVNLLLTVPSWTQPWERELYAGIGAFLNIALDGGSLDLQGTTIQVDGGHLQLDSIYLTNGTINSGKGEVTFNNSSLTLTDNFPNLDINNHSSLNISEGSAINDGDINIGLNSIINTFRGDLSNSRVNLHNNSTAQLGECLLGVIRSHSNSYAQVHNCTITSSFPRQQSWEGLGAFEGGALDISMGENATPIDLNTIGLSAENGTVNLSELTLINGDVDVNLGSKLRLDTVVFTGGSILTASGSSSRISSSTIDGLLSFNKSNGDINGGSLGQLQLYLGSNVQLNSTTIVGTGENWSVDINANSSLSADAITLDNNVGDFNVSNGSFVWLGSGDLGQNNVNCDGQVYLQWNNGAGSDTLTSAFNAAAVNCSSINIVE
jgi:hypothetical protein